MQAMRYLPDYDFSHEGVDWSEYKREVRLRTDALYERHALKDYFRLFYKIFYWDPNSKKYFLPMPLHNIINSPDNWRLKEFRGYHPTGSTQSFHKPRGTEHQFRSVSITHSDTLRDKNVLCYYRFRAYKKCEGNRLFPLIHERLSPAGEPETVNMDCYGEMMDMLQYCSHVQLNWLADLWHHLEIQNDPTMAGQTGEVDMMMDEFDSPNTTKLSY